MQIILCKKYQEELPSLDAPPLPGEKGMHIFKNYSKKAWVAWINLQTMLINENHLDLSDKSNRKWLNKQMELFLDNKDYQRPSGYIPE